MKKELWLKADTKKWQDKKEKITTALEQGYNTVLINDEDVEKTRELGNIKTASYGDKADIKVAGKNGEGDGTKTLPIGPNSSEDIETLKDFKGETAEYIIITDKKHEEFASQIAEKVDYIIIRGEDWKIIPLENLIAELQEKDVKIITGIENSTELETALKTLEVGSDGVLLETNDIQEIIKASEKLEEFQEGEIELTEATIKKIEPVGMGDRVCVDTCSLMKKGEGMLVGSSSTGLFLIHSESIESPYVAARPFRVNAGGVHAYLKTPGNKTVYLSELEAGDEVLIVNNEGKTKKAVVGRSKIEKRPLMLIEAETENTTIKTVLQNAETIRLVDPEGKPKSISELKEGDKVLVNTEEKARHFGMEVTETIKEK
ncbi:3-dehydroquinate synthase II [Methanonatronarchaeum sp. AMET-Sl]|uniref:3-dehydroquinate synthase II n=1 Tax=Methanonatronarchaeum sp. AMET-Sl TaxID=3037654 RepID=UPI00244E4335|nr:3-dehydroquinate synthase II [Methanonatronarchaeum sp. AMET-Sl]WGI17991.1 3-dehydroquinate synthase II [Methanonatronarchaeum sp. AMET-Sl]